MSRNIVRVFLAAVAFSAGSNSVLAKLEPGPTDGRPRAIVTSDGEIDDECSMVRFLLYANEWDVEAIITSSSQYHWQGQQGDTYEGAIDIVDAEKQDASFTVPGDGGKGETIHVICEVTDNGTPPLTRYRRVVVEIE